MDCIRSNFACWGTLGCLFWWLGGYSAAVRGDELPPGFERVQGRYIDVITDMPLSDAIRELPQVFDAAVPQWCELFSLSPDEVADWRVEAFIMLDRPRFQQAGFLPGELPQFPYGFQWGDRLWVAEQPSDYYRRHLLLHEGTHWFMTRKYGRQGPPWLMEGMAEWLGTHRWDGQQLRMGIIPADKNEVPYWGRISLIQQQLADGVAPSLENVLRYGDSAHQQVEAYAWSWAAVIFLRHHPQTRTIFEQLLDQPARPRDDTNRWLFQRLAQQWPQLRQAWQAMLTELEYGYDPSRGMLEFSAAPRKLAGAQTVSVSADQSWQASGLTVEAGQKIRIQAAGEYIVGRVPADWLCRPEGVTLEYYRGQPLGKLLLSVATPLPREPSFSQPLNIFPIGSQGELTMPHTGELQFRINESSGGLADNAGELTVTVQP